MTRKEEIYKAARDYLFNFFIPSGVRIEEWNTCFEAGAKWADEHTKNPWRDAKKELPIMGELVNVASGRGVSFMRYIEPTDFIDNNVEYWMPIPELKKGGMSDEK